MKALVILNPPAVETERLELRAMLDRHFAAAPIDYDIHETRQGEPLAEIVRGRLQGGVDFVVAIGGDGTVSAVSDALVGRTIPLGIVPTGTGNLIARELDIPQDVEAAIALIAGAPHTRTIDAMRLGGRTYILNVSVGISAAVIGDTTRQTKHRYGRIAYVVATLLKVLTSRPRYLVVEIDGKPHPYRAVEVAVMNCGRLGALLYPKGPDIRIDDGQLGVWILSMKSRWCYPRYVFGLVTGRRANPDAHFFSAQQRVNIRSNVPLPVQADGDMIGTTPVDVAVLPGALRVMVAGSPSPAAASHRAA